MAALEHTTSAEAERNPTVHVSIHYTRYSVNDRCSLPLLFRVLFCFFRAFCIQQLMRGEAFAFSTPSALTTQVATEGTFGLSSASRCFGTEHSSGLPARIGFRSKCKAKNSGGGRVFGRSSVSGLMGLRAELGGVVSERVQQEQAVSVLPFFWSNRETIQTRS